MISKKKTQMKDYKVKEKMKYVDVFLATLKKYVTQRSLFCKSMPYKTLFFSRFVRFISHTFGIICVISKLFLLLIDKIIKSINKKRKFTKNNVGHIKLKTTLPLVFRDSAHSTLVGLFHKK